MITATSSSDYIGGGGVARFLGRTLAVLALILGLAACATPPEDPEAKAAYEQANDPLEPVNRAVFEFNMAVDKVVLRPAAKGYELLPDLIRDGIRNFLRHLRSPIILVNDLLQGETERAGDTMGRFVFNTLVFGGVFDAASDAGVEFHDEDFGQTLAVWGMDSGPYLMLPFLGPSNLRDTGGMVVDRYLDPVTYWADNTSRDWAEYSGLIIGVTTAIDTRSRNYRQLEDLEETSLDFYATVRSLYRQKRAAAIANEVGASDAPTPGMGFDGQSDEAASADPFATFEPEAVALETGAETGDPASTQTSQAPQE